MEERSTRLRCHGMLKLYKSGICVAILILAKFEIKLVRRPDVLKIKKMYSFNSKIVSSVCSLHFSDVEVPIF